MADGCMFTYFNYQSVVEWVELDDVGRGTKGAFSRLRALSLIIDA